MKRVFVRDEIVAGVNDVCAPEYRATRDGSNYRAIPYGISLTARGERYNAAAARLEKVCRDARIAAKLDRVLDLAGRSIVQSVPDAGPTPAELAAQWHRAYAARAEQECAEAKAAYDARNPHKKEGKQ